MIASYDQILRTRYCELGQLAFHQVREEAPVRGAQVSEGDASARELDRVAADRAEEEVRHAGLGKSAQDRVGIARGDDVAALVFAEEEGGGIDVAPAR